MAFDEGMGNTINRLHETIRSQTNATNRQSNIMIGLTISLFVLAIIQTILLIFQICPSFFLRFPNLF